MEVCYILYNKCKYNHPFQIKINKEDIDDIRIHGGAIPPEVDNRLNDLQTKVGMLTSLHACCRKIKHFFSSVVLFLFIQLHCFDILISTSELYE